MKIGSLTLDHPVALAPMAGMTDTAFRRLVKRMGGCGLVVTEMVSSEGLVRGIDRTLEYAEYTEEERPVSIQIFGGDPQVMADAAQVVEGMGADIVDINMGCPVPKIAKHNAGLQPDARAGARGERRARHGQGGADSRDGQDARRLERASRSTRPTLARMVQDAGAAAVAVHGRTAAQSYTGESDWTLIARSRPTVEIPVFGSGDCVEAPQIVTRLRELRRERRAGWSRRACAIRGSSAQSADALAGCGPATCRSRIAARSCSTTSICFSRSASTKRTASGTPRPATECERAAAGRRARPRALGDQQSCARLGSWYTKGLDGGSQLRVAINSAQSIPHLRDIITGFFFSEDRQLAQAEFCHQTNKWPISSGSASRPPAYIGRIDQLSAESVRPLTLARQSSR